MRGNIALRLAFVLQCMYIMYNNIFWDNCKASILKETRGIDLNKVVDLIRAGKFEMEMVPNQQVHAGQRMFVVNLDGYVCCVPFVEMGKEGIFIKTAFKSRVFQKKYKDVLK